jgi:hypothetical protein
LELGGYARIGGYHIYQAWYFSDQRFIMARLFSRGLSCNMDHDHHAYWRFDVDASGAADDQITIADATGNALYVVEQNDTKDPSGTKRWFVKDQPTGKGLWIIPGSADGVADKFSTKDAGARQYHTAEDEDWRFGARGHLGYDDGESVDRQDVVLWYVTHMHHVAAAGAGTWHSTGPNLYVQP